MKTLDLKARYESTSHARQVFLERGTTRLGGVRDIVLASWRRSGSSHVNPDMTGAPVSLTDDTLRAARSEHVLNSMIPMVRRLLVEEGSGVLVVAGDARGNALWVDGDSDVRRLAERINLFAGSSWNENDIGTNGIGTAIAIGAPVQVFGSEHFASGLHGWSCTGSPIHDPASGEILGFLDISGGPAIASPQAAMLVRSAVGAVERELRIVGLTTRTRARRSVARLSVLGRDRATLEVDGRTQAISLRHAELLLMLASRPEGVAASELAWLMYEEDAADVTVRAEMSRLRKTHPGLLSAERPYRLRRELRTDADEVTEALRNGSLERAVELYRGPVLPRSVAPGVVDLRYYLSGWLRAALLRDAGPDLLVRYAYSPDGRLDAEIWRACHDRLPADSPRLAEVQAMLSNVDRQLS